ncbi:hypothetical protein ONA70_25645, partial [Micromonospora yasonensis]|uniref:hypothetical protein n=1 Tax=Micromonospora yasonensis TaxID=1128667 RepID=UPI00222E380B
MSGGTALLAAPTAAGQRIRHGLLAGAEWAAPLAALALGVWALGRGDAADIGSLGLVTALPPELY